MEIMKINKTVTVIFIFKWIRKIDYYFYEFETLTNYSQCFFFKE